MKKLFAIAGGSLLVAGLGVCAPSVSSAALPTSPGDDATAAARDYIQENPTKVRGSTRDEYQVVDTISAPNGESHVRFHRTYNDLPVLGGDLVVHLTEAERANGLSLTQDKVITAQTIPKIGKTDAAQRAQGEFSGRDSGKAGSPTLVIDAREGTPVLAWKTTVTGTQADGQTPSRRIVVTDANTGKVRSSTETILTPIKLGQSAQGALAKPTKGVAATGSGRGVFVGTVSLSTTLSGSTYWGTGLQSNRESAGVDAHYGAAKTFDYFKTKFGRNGIFNNGSGVPSRVHAGNSYVNAYWDGTQMTYGDGAGNQSPLVELDVAGHEMSHGVTENTAGLDYSGDAGGLNEATSDIFGTMVEFYANNPSDTPDFLIGEEININGDGTPLRYMDKPSKDGGSYDCWNSSVPNSDPHYSSGVGNHFFFLLANGSGASTYGKSPTCNGSTVAGIGRDKAAAIWFAAL